ncbi:MAG TPA: type IV pilin protein [Luteibacter sp.]|jgi:type IV pilus assembly protein PilE|uniref:type IV pilin protein n=1 Tax=Luteibacter sp. TaxID=1886636 RepID=UPI002F3F9027
MFTDIGRLRMRRTAGTRGFTLIELMIVIAVIAVLAMIAVPNYLRYGYRARRGEAQEALLRLATAQERYYSTYNTYAASVTGDLKWSSATLTSGNYVLSVAPLAGTADVKTGYIATATAQSVQLKDSCGNLTLDSRNNKSQSGSTTANGACW